MDYALLAATALGGVALYLMLPRERAPLVKLGGLLAVLAFGGLFLYMFRALVASSGGTGGMGGVDPYFYVFAGVMIAGTIGVICQPKPVYAALYFVLVTLAGAGLFILLLAEFMAIVLVIIYAGAILVTYVFVIMLASQATCGVGGEAKSPLYDREAAEPLLATLVSFVLLGAVLQCLYPVPGRELVGGPRHSDARMIDRINGVTAADIAKPKDELAAPVAALPKGFSPGATAAVPDIDAVKVDEGDKKAAERAAARAVATSPTTKPVDEAKAVANSGKPPMGDTQLLGNTLYGQYALSLELAGILLTIALVGAVVIARKEAPEGTLGAGAVPHE